MDLTRLSLILLCLCEGSHSVTQSYPTLCNPTDCSPPGPSVHGILQTRILQWVAISYSRGSSQPRDQTTSPVSPTLAGKFFTKKQNKDAILLAHLNP